MAQRHVTGHRLDHLARLHRRAGADGVAERDLVAAHVPQSLRHAGGDGGVDVALIGAAQHAGDVPAHAPAQLLGPRRDGGEALQALVDRAVDVLLAEALRGGAEDGDLVHAGGLLGGLHALHVGHQDRIADPVQAVDLGQDLGRVGHLRHPFGRGEAARLDGAQAGGGQGVNQRHLGRCRHLAGLVLQAVTRPHFDDLHALGSHGVSSYMCRLSLSRSHQPRHPRA